MNIVEVKTVRTETRKTVTLHGALIRDLLEHMGVDVPLTASVVVEVPGGGDWSNTELDIDQHPVIVSWTEVEVQS